MLSVIMAHNQTNFTVNRNQNKKLTREQLLLLDKQELVDTIIQLQVYNKQLKNIISKNNQNDGQKKSKSDAAKPRKSFDFSKHSKRRILLRVAYFGWNYQGLAVQEDFSETIEDYLFAALTKGCLIESRETSGYHRCGRTDKGVSASGQVISIELRSKLSKGEQNDPNNRANELPYCKILNRLLPLDIKAVSWYPLGDEEPLYSARFNCKQRTYKYWFPAGDLDIAAMKSGCKLFLGSHDFRNICKMDVANGVTAFIRCVNYIDIIPESPNRLSNNGYDMYCLVISANAFLWHQIRCIMALLLLIGKRVEEPSVITQLLDTENNPRKPQYNMAVELPLNLFHCSYDILKEENQNSWITDEENLEFVIKNFQCQWTKAAIKAAMIRDVVDNLEKLHNGNHNYQSDDLLQGVKSKVHVPLLKRNTCESLENRISHYLKKKRLKTAEEGESSSQ